MSKVKARIETGRVAFEDGGDSVTIRHLQTGVSVQVSKPAMDRWGIAQLRAMISSPAVPAIAPPKSGR